MGLPLPLPMGGIPPPPGAPSPPALGFLMVSSTERIKHVASEAAVSALIFTIAGSHTQPSKLSEMSSFIMFTPNHLPPENISKNHNNQNYMLYICISYCLFIAEKSTIFQSCRLRFCTLASNQRPKDSAFSLKQNLLHKANFLNYHVQSYQLYR